MPVRLQTPKVSAPSSHVLFEPNARATRVDLRAYRESLTSLVQENNGSLPSHFLAGWKSLTDLDVSLLAEIGCRDVGSNFCEGCTSLRTLHGVGPLSRTVAMAPGAGFLHGVPVDVTVSDRSTVVGPLSVALRDRSSGKSTATSLRFPLLCVAVALVFAAFAAVNRGDATASSSEQLPCMCEKLVQLDGALRRHVLLRRAIASSQMLSPGDTKWIALHVVTVLPPEAIYHWLVRHVTQSDSTSTENTAAAAVLALQHPLSTVSDVEAFLQRELIAGQLLMGQGSKKSTVGCAFVVIPLSLVSADALNTIKEITESNTLRGTPLLPGGVVVTAMFVGTATRSELLERYNHRTVHVLQTESLLGL